MLLPEKDRGPFIDSFTGESRTVLDYLTADVLDLLEPEDRAFLLQVSVLTRLNAPLCDAVVGATGSGERLAALERANLFVFIDADGSWYHQHRLFAEALRLELRRTRPDLVPGSTRVPLGGSPRTATWRPRPSTRSPRATSRRPRT